MWQGGDAVKRFFALEYYWRRLFFGLLPLTLVLGYGLGPVYRETKGPVWNGIRNPDSESVKANHFVDQLVDFHRVNVERIEMNFGHSLTPQDLQFIYDFTRKIRVQTTWATVSPATYRKAIGEVLEAYIAARISQNIDMDKWRKEVAANPVIQKKLLLVSKDYQRASILLAVPAELNELDVNRLVDDILEDVHLNTFWQKVWHEVKWFFWKYDLHPYQVPGGPRISVYSWAKGRGAIDQGLNRDINLKFSLGFLFITAPWTIVCFHFLPQYFLPVLLSMVLSLVFTMGSIWPAHLVWIYRTVFTLVSLSLALVSTQSFSNQYMDAYRDNEEKDPIARWRSAAHSSHYAIIVIMAGTFLAFAFFTGCFRNVWRMIELAYVFAMGSFFAWLNATFFLPALHLAWIKTFGERQEENLTKPEKAICKGIEWFLDSLVRISTICNIALCRHSLVRKVVGGAASAVFMIAVMYYAKGYMETVSKPLEFLDKDSNTVQMAQDAIRDDGPGYDAFQIMFGNPQVKDEVLGNKEFLLAIEAFEQEVEKITDIRSVFSSADEVLYQWRNNTALEGDTQQAANLVIDGEESIHADLPSYLHTRNYVQILAFHPMDRSDTLRQALDSIKAAAKNFIANSPEYKDNIFAFGEIPIYLEIAEQVPQNMPQNVLGSTAFMIILYIVVIAALNRIYDGNVSPWRARWALSQPFIMANGVTALIMMWKGIPLDRSTAPITEIAIAAAADFNVYPTILMLMLRYRGMKQLYALKEAMGEKGKASVKDYVGNLISFTPLDFSVFSPVHNLGIMIQTNLTVCAVWGLTTTLPIILGNVPKEELYEQEEITDIVTTHSAVLP